MITSFLFLSSLSERFKERTHCLWKNSSLINLRQSARINKNLSIDLLRSNARKIDINKFSFELLERVFFFLFFLFESQFFSFFFFSYLVYSSFFINNRSLNTKKIKILAKIHRVSTSEHKNQFFMFEDFVDSFYQEFEFSFIRSTFSKLTTEVFDLSQSTKITKSRFSTRTIVKNLKSHDSMSKNFKRKQRAKMNSLEKVVKLDNRSKNRTTYNKTSYNRDVVTIFLIVSKKEYNLSIFQKFTSKVVATIRFLYNLMSNSKKIQNLVQTQKFLNFQVFDYIN